MELNAHRHAGRLICLIALFWTGLVPSALAIEQDPPPPPVVQTSSASPPSEAENAAEPVGVEVVIANRTVAISFGSSGVISQVASGIVLVYSRAFKTGDFVQVGDTEGTVYSIGLLSTKIETTKREQVSIPNNVIMNNPSKNFSSLAETHGVIVYTSITIGYDTPWRQVHALLLLAADRTAGLGKEPPPFVLQKGLNDFYVEYQLNAYLLEPARRNRVLADLHANIQDAFNEYGVQITSPHYEADPATPKIVPRTGWYAPPAKPPVEPPALGPTEAAGS